MIPSPAGKYEKRVRNMGDRISNLPDEILCHILSFLPTREAVATSILSKRWTHLWSSVPTLDFDHRIYLRKQHNAFPFERTVHSTILARDAQQPITRFRLKYVASDHQSNADVNTWVNTALRRGIENLDIQIYANTMDFNLISLTTCSILSSKTLVVLKLQKLSLKAYSSVHLPSLKSLDLKFVTFQEPRYLMELLYGCPMLEDFKTRLLEYAHHGSVCTQGFKLPKLVRADLRYLHMVDRDFLLKATSNAQFLTFKQTRVREVPEFPHARHLSLSQSINDPHVLLLMLKNCPKLQSFKLSGRFEAEDVLPYPPFTVPECLTSHFKVCCLKYSPDTESSDLHFAKYIMQNSTSLQSMKIRCDQLSQLAKLEMAKELALCTRKSASCQLSFEDRFYSSCK